MEDKAIKYIAEVKPSLPATQRKDALWEQLPQKKRVVANQRLDLLTSIITTILGGVSASAAVKKFLLEVKTDKAEPRIAELSKTLGRGGKAVSRATLLRWLSAYEDDGLMGLAPAHKGSDRTTGEWEARALYYLRSMANNNAGNITRFLQQDGFDCQYSQVLSWFKSLPSDVQNNRGKLGTLKFASTQLPYTRRSTANITVGEYYQTDGNMMPIYLQHPTGNSPCRYEITPVIDVRSRYIVAYHLSSSESANSTLHAITRAVVETGHVPIEIQADNGPGFNNHRVRNFYNKLGINEFHPRPGNPQDNGLIERWNRILKDEFLKKMVGYSGKESAPEPMKKLLGRYQKDRNILMTEAQFVCELNQYIHWYNHERVHNTIKCTPASLWADLKPNPPVDIADAFFWDQIERTVRRQVITLATLEYIAPELIQYNGKKVVVEYNHFDGDFVKVRTLDGRWICDAKKVHSKDYRYQSIQEKQKLNSTQQKLKRIDAKREETLLRAGLNKTHEHTLDAINELTTDVKESVTQEEGKEKDFSDIVLKSPESATTDSGKASEIELDIFSTTYLGKD